MARLGALGRPATRGTASPTPDPRPPYRELPRRQLPPSSDFGARHHPDWDRTCLQAERPDSNPREHTASMRIDVGAAKEYGRRMLTHRRVAMAMVVGLVSVASAIDAVPALGRVAEPDRRADRRGHGRLRAGPGERAGRSPRSRGTAPGCRAASGRRVVVQHGKRRHAAAHLGTSVRPCGAPHRCTRAHALACTAAAGGTPCARTRCGRPGLRDRPRGHAGHRVAGRR